MKSSYLFNSNSNEIKAASLALNQLKRDSSETFGIQKELNRFYVLLMENKCTAKELEERCLDFNNAGYKFVKIRFFNKKHNNVNIRNYTDDDILNGAFQRLYSALVTYRSTGDNSLIKRYRSLFETLLGAVDLEKIAKETSTLIPVTLSGKPGYIYWNVYEDQVETHDIGGMMAWIRSSEIPTRFLYQKVVDKYNMYSSANENKQIFAFVDTNMNGFLYPENIINTIPDFYLKELILKLQELKACLRSHDKMSNYLLSYIELGNGRYFFCLTASTNEVIANISTIIFDIIIIIGAILLSASLYKIASTIDNSRTNSSEETKENTTSILPSNSEKKLNNIYRLNKYAVLSTIYLLISLIIFFVSVNIFVSRFSNKNKKEKMHSNLLSVIDWLDEGYDIAKKELSDKWLMLAKDEDIKSLNQEAINNIANSLKKEHSIDRLFITDKNGKILYSLTNDNNSSIFNKIIPVIARKIASERFGTEESWNSKIDSLMVNSIGQSFSELIGDNALNILKAFENFDTVSEIDLGNKRHLIFSTLIESQNNEKYVMIIWLDSQYFSQDYLVNKIKDSQSLPENLKQIMLAMVPIHLDNQPYPPEITKYSFSRDVTERIKYTKRSSDFMTKIGEQSYYGIGTILSSIPNYVIFALQAEE